LAFHFISIHPICTGVQIMELNSEYEMGRRNPVVWRTTIRDSR